MTQVVRMLCVALAARCCCTKILCGRASTVPVCWWSQADRHWYFYSRDSVECWGLFWNDVRAPKFLLFDSFSLHYLMSLWIIDLCFSLPFWCMSNKYIPVPYFSAYNVFFFVSLKVLVVLFHLMALLWYHCGQYAGVGVQLRSGPNLLQRDTTRHNNTCCHCAGK